MAGLSSRFTDAGYVLPKYMLYAVDQSLFSIAVSSFKNYFQSCRFIFVCRDLFDTKRFVELECGKLGIGRFRVALLNAPTRGQAETVFMGIEQANVEEDEPVLIFNIDTFRPGYTFPKLINSWDGYLETFKGHGSNWSYAKTLSPDSTQVVETAEKREISDNCSTGIYYFKSASLFRTAYQKCLADGVNHELYVAPLYNNLIRDGHDIHIHVIPRREVIFCGIPQEYRDYIFMRIND